jgi:hypothetical protein
MHAVATAVARKLPDTAMAVAMASACRQAHRAGSVVAFATSKILPEK